MHDTGNGAKASECSAPAIPDMSAEYNGSSELGVRQPVAVGQKQLPPIRPGGAPTFVSEKQYDAILRRRDRRARVNAGRERKHLKANNSRPRGSKGRLVVTRGNQWTDGSSMVPSITAIRDCYLRFIATIGNQDVTTGGSEAQSSAPAVDFYWPFVATNEGEENVGEVTYGSNTARDLSWPFIGTSEYKENVGESAYGSEAPISYPPVDFYWPYVATNDDEENMGEVAYDSILNLESPDCTALLRTMMGDMYGTEVSEQFENVAHLQAPDFATLLTIMNNAGYDEAQDDGHYDVDKVMTKLEGW